MKKSKKPLVVLIVIVVCVSLCISLTACFNKISFSLENVQTILNDEYYSDTTGPHFQMVNNIESKDKLNAFFNTEYFGNNKAMELTQFDDNYFKANNLLVVCMLSGEDYIIEIVELSVRSKELLVHIQTNKGSSVKRKYFYYFISVDKNDVANINKFSYIIKS